MKIYKSIQEAVANGCKGPIHYFVNKHEVPVTEYRQAEGKVTVYRSGHEIHAEKN